MDDPHNRWLAGVLGAKEYSYDCTLYGMTTWEFGELMRGGYQPAAKYDNHLVSLSYLGLWVEGEDAKNFSSR